MSDEAPRSKLRGILRNSPKPLPSFAKAILLTTALVDTQALDRLKVEQAMPDAVAKSMNEAVDWILEDGKTVLR